MNKVIGRPNYDTLHLLHNEIKYNAISVQSNLGGGQHGYLGLVVRPTTYVMISKNHFVNPVHPGTLIIPVLQTHQNQDELKRHYSKNLRIFHQMGEVERALI